MIFRIETALGELCVPVFCGMVQHVMAGYLDGGRYFACNRRREYDRNSTHPWREYDPPPSGYPRESFVLPNRSFVIVCPD